MACLILLFNWVIVAIPISPITKVETNNKGSNLEPNKGEIKA